VNVFDRLVRVMPYVTVRAYELLLSVRGDAVLTAIDEHVRPGSVAVDIGAHRGWYTHRLALRAGPSGRIHAIEPNRDGLLVLEAVARRHPTITVHRIAVSDHSGTGQLRRPIIDGRRTDAMGSLSNPTIDSVPHDVIDVPIDRLDNLLRDERDRIAFMKCDVEGHEHEVLVGAEHVIRQSRPIILVEIEQRHRARPLEETFSWLADQGYDGHFLTGRQQRPLREFDVERDQLRYVSAPMHPGRPHPDYVSDFLFIPSSPPKRC
jgi:FkbM family methyltransferase